MRKLLLVLITGLLAVLAVGCSEDEEVVGTTSVTPTSSPVETVTTTPVGRFEELTVNIVPITSLGQAGTAVIREARRNETIEISLSVPGLTGDGHPAELRWSQPHDRQCEFALNGAVVQSLNDIVESVSVTEIDVALYTFANSAPYVIVIYESPDQTEVPLGCGAVNYTATG
jgi:hypothetical protein